MKELLYIVTIVVLQEFSTPCHHSAIDPVTGMETPSVTAGYCFETKSDTITRYLSQEEYGRFKEGLKSRSDVEVVEVKKYELVEVVE